MFCPLENLLYLNRACLSYCGFIRGQSATGSNAADESRQGDEVK